MDSHETACEQRSRGPAAWRRRAVACLLVAAVIVVPPADAQQRDTTRADTTRARADSLLNFERIGSPGATTRAPLSPRRAFLYSFLAPGLGQARLDRPGGGSLFASVELAAIAMAVKSRDELRFARRAGRPLIIESYRTDASGSPVLDSLGRLQVQDSVPNRYTGRVRARRVHYEDWVAVLIFNHLFAGADAFVAAQLWDMPVRGSVRATGPRSGSVRATVEFGGRRR